MLVWFLKASLVVVQPIQTGIGLPDFLLGPVIVDVLLAVLDVVISQSQKRQLFVETRTHNSTARYSILYG